MFSLYFEMIIIILFLQIAPEYVASAKSDGTFLYISKDFTLSTKEPPNILNNKNQIFYFYNYKNYLIYILIIIILQILFKILFLFY